MATKKAGGTSSNLRDSQGQRLGIKIYGGEAIHSGNIIVRQRGSRYRLGPGTRMGKDHTIFATADGVVEFKEKMVRKFTGKLEAAQFVSVLPTTKA